MLRVEPQVAGGRFLWLAWAAALGFTLLLTVLAAGHAWFPGDVRLARQIQEIEAGAPASYLGDLVYNLGRSTLFLASGAGIAVAFAVGRHNHAALFLLLCVAARSFGALVKEWAERPRPVAGVVEVNEYPADFSFPSGHVLGSVLVWGFLFYFATTTIAHRGLRLAIQAISLLVPILTGLQRVQAGAHWPSDVLGGFLWGFILLFLVIKAFDLLKPRVAVPTR